MFNIWIKDKTKQRYLKRRPEREEGAKDSWVLEVKQKKAVHCDERFRDSKHGDNLIQQHQHSVT
jgi:hypothetical protein